MSAPDLKPAYLVTGNDLPKMERTLDRLRGRFDPGSIERLVVGGRDGATGHDVVVACNSGTLLAGSVVTREALEGAGAAIVVQTLDEIADALMLPAGA